MDENPASHKDIIRCLGGPVALARGLGKTRSCVEQWSKRNNIPGRYFATVAQYAEGKGLSNISEAVLAALCADAARDAEKPQHECAA